jgi:hypothetical protein
MTNGAARVSHLAGDDRSDRAGDGLATLGRLLPRGSDRCVLARPAALTADQRALLKAVSRAEAAAWASNMRVLAYASAQRDVPDGPGARASFLRLDGPREQFRQLLEQSGGMSLRSGAFDCGPKGCRRVHTSYPDEGLLRIDRGRFPTVARDGAERRCRKLLTLHPDAVEVAASRSRDPRKVEAGAVMRSSSVVTQIDGGVRVVRTLLMPGPRIARRVRDELLGGRLGAFGIPGTTPRVTVDDAQVRQVAVMLWEDLRLIRDDAERLRDAERQARALEQMRPGGVVDYADRESLLAQIGFRLQLLRESSGDRGPTARELATVLTRALDLYPDDEGLALVLAELALGELNDGALAMELAEQHVARAGSDVRWRLYRRHAAALTSVEGLARALVDDGLIDGRRAGHVANEIIARLAEGATYVDAERKALQLADKKPRRLP